MIICLPFLRFKTKVLHVSSLLKDRRRTPLEETGDWLEYVIRHGGAQHLRAQVFNMPWYQRYLLDVMAFLVAIVTLIIVAIWFACRCCRRLCCKLTENKPKKEWNTETQAWLLFQKWYIALMTRCFWNLFFIFFDENKTCFEWNIINHPKHVLFSLKYIKYVFIKWTSKALCGSSKRHLTLCCYEALVILQKW